MAASPALRPALALNGVMVLTIAAVLALPVMAPAVSAATGLPTSALGVYSFLMWTAAMLASGVIGRHVARFGAVRTVQASLALAAAGLLAGASGTPAGFALAPVLIGIACALETPASSEVLARATPAAQRTFIFSLKQTGVQIGGMISGVAFPAALPVLGWRGALLALAALIAASAVALEPMRRRRDVARPTTAPHGGGLRSVAEIWRRPGLRGLVVASLVFHGMQICLNTFLVTYLVNERGYTLAAAGLALTIAQFGGFVGRLGFGFVVGPRLGVMRLLTGIGFGMTAAGLATGLAAGALAPWALALLWFLFGLTASGWNGVFLAEVARQAPPGEIARVTGGVMVSAYAGLIAGPVAFTAAGAAAGTLGAGYILLAAGTAAGTLVLRRVGARPV